MNGSFLVAPQMGAYLRNLDNDGGAICVTIPSMAEHLVYRVADRLVCALRSLGFEEAHVCTVDGMPATPEAIAEESDLEETSEQSSKKTLNPEALKFRDLTEDTPPTSQENEKSAR